MTKARYQRILLKLSGECLSAERAEVVFADDGLERVCEELGQVLTLGVEVALVVGGGNIFRGGRSAVKGLDRVTADHVGMLATVQNCLVLRDVLTNRGIPAEIFGAFPIEGMIERMRRDRALAALRNGSVVLFAGGTGNPFVSTDTAAVLRALEIDAQVLLKATKVDGIYDADPKVVPTARRFSHLGYREALERRLAVMDLAAFSLCMEQGLRVVVFDFSPPGNLRRAVLGEEVGTVLGDR
ncbi:MAG: UMP kinase [Deltaproteobacteria bacterium RIFOXYA12_FULL_61_11]|nr:MAG: UMP kinase [Deltaproteobacteria bacterium RIFOXYA12_FULL_61_11]